jgi:hypothetical protein
MHFTPSLNDNQFQNVIEGEPKIMAFLFRAILNTGLG